MSGDKFFKCHTHGIPYPKGCVCPACDASRMPRTAESDIPSLHETNSGSLQRIADATEAMAHNYQQLIDERDRFQRDSWAAQRRGECLERSNAGLRGHITRLKREAAHE